MLFSVQNTTFVTGKKGKMGVTDTYVCRVGWQKVIRAGFRWVEAVLMAGFIDRRQLNFISFPHRH